MGDIGKYRNKYCELKRKILWNPKNKKDYQIWMDIFSTCDSPDWLSYLHYYVLFVKYNDDISEFPKTIRKSWYNKKIWTFLGKSYEEKRNTPKSDLSMIGWERDHAYARYCGTISFEQWNIANGFGWNGETKADHTKSWVCTESDQFEGIAIEIAWKR